MSSCRITLALVIFAAAFVASAAEKNELDMDAGGTIEIGADGVVRSFQLNNELAPQVAELVERNVRSWQFQPVVVNGTAVAAKTGVRLTLTAVPQAGETDRYAIRIANVIFGAPNPLAHMKPPHYPENAVHAHIGARVLLSLRLDEDGKVAEVMPYQTSLDVRTSSENEAERWRKVFEQASMRAVRDWKFELTETINGRQIGTKVLLPLSFSLCEMPCRSSDSEGKWKAYVPGPEHPAPWFETAHVANSQNALKDGQALAAESQFQLKEKVIGKML